MNQADNVPENSNRKQSSRKGKESNRGFELDENLPSGTNGGWAAKGGQVDGKPKQADSTSESTHQGKTRSDTNSQ